MVDDRSPIVLVGHDDQETFLCIFVRLQLVVRAVYTRTSRQEQQQLGGRMWVVGRLRNVDFDVVVLGDFLHTPLSLIVSLAVHRR